MVNITTGGGPISTKNFQNFFGLNLGLEGMTEARESG